MLRTICPSPDALIEFARSGQGAHVASHLEAGCSDCGREIVELMARDVDVLPDDPGGSTPLPDALWNDIEAAHLAPENLPVARVVRLRPGPEPVLSGEDGTPLALAAAGGMRGEGNGWSAQILLADDIRAWLMVASTELRVRTTRDDRPLEGVSIVVRRSEGADILDRVRTDRRGRARIPLEGDELRVELRGPDTPPA